MAVGNFKLRPVTAAGHTCASSASGRPCHSSSWQRRQRQRQGGACLEGPHPAGPQRPGFTAHLPDSSHFPC